MHVCCIVIFAGFLCTVQSYWGLHNISAAPAFVDSCNSVHTFVVESFDVFMLSPGEKHALAFEI